MSHDCSCWCQRLLPSDVVVEGRCCCEDDVDGGGCPVLAREVPDEGVDLGGVLLLGFGLSGLLHLLPERRALTEVVQALLAVGARARSELLAGLVEDLLW